MRKNRRRSPSQIAKSYKRALSDLIEALDDVGDFEVEGGCMGDGPLVRACRAIRKPLPPNLKAWLADYDGVVMEDAA